VRILDARLTEFLVVLASLNVLDVVGISDFNMFKLSISLARELASSKFIEI
jgi:hypothetical protein